MKHNFSVLNYDDGSVPTFEERTGQEYIDYGYDNQYDLYLRELYLGSSIHNAVCQGVAEMVYGEGLDATDREDSDGKKEQWLRLQQLMEGSEEDLIKRLCVDLKIYGQCYINTIWNKARTAIVQMKHVPVHCVRVGVANGDGAVERYYIKRDWTDRHEKAVVIPAFNTKDRSVASQLYMVKRYAPSYHYYGLPDYVGSTNYIELDIKVSQFHLNNISNGLFPSMMISFKNGVPTDEERMRIEQQILHKFSGAQNAGRVLLTFNDGDDSAPEFTPITTNDADGLYQYISEEVSKKVLTGHRVTSPLLFGIRGDGSGFGSNADELRDSYSLFNNTVVLPFQNLLLGCLSTIFKVNDINLDLYFKTLKPADFLDIQTKQTQSEDEAEKEGYTDDFEDEKQEFFSSALVELDAMGQDEDELLEGYQQIDSRQVDYDYEDALDAQWDFAKVLSGNKSKESEQDIGPILVRYAYMPKKSNLPGSGKSRDFCEKMMATNKVYRKEDIIAAGTKAVNPGWGPNGSDTYSVWLYKGGGSCRHFWERRTYLKKGQEQISVNQARKILRQLDEKLIQNEKEVAKRPRDMKNRGFLEPKNWTTPR